jgi:hypothetical protein
VKLPVLALVALAGLRARWRTLLAFALVAAASVLLSFLLFAPRHIAPISRAWPSTPAP